MAIDTLDWIIIGSVLLVSLAIGLVVRKRAEGGLADFFLGGRNLPWYIAGISMVATTFAADTPLAVSEMIAQAGISQNWLWWSFLAGGLLTAVFFARMWRRANIVTELEFIELRYQGKAAHWLRMFKAVYLGLFMNGMVIGWVNLAFISLLEQFFGLSGATVWWVTLAAMAFAALYSSISGLLGVALADTVQFVIAMTGSIVLAVLVVDSDAVGGISGLKATLPAETFRLFPQIGSETSGTDVLSLTAGAFAAFALVQWWASWYPGAEPGGGGYIAQRMMSVRTERDAFRATVLFQVAHYCLRPWPWILVGLAALALYSPEYAQEQFPEMQQVLTWQEEGKSKDEVFQLLGGADQLSAELQKQVAFTYAPRSGYLQAMIDFLPPGWRGLLLVAFLSAYLSTISTQLNMGASFLVNDLLQVQKKRPLERKEAVRWGRLATVFIMLCGLGITTQLTSIAQVWEWIMEAGAGLGAVLILRWFWWRINAWSEITAMIAPLVGYVIGTFLLEDILGEWFISNKGTFLFTVLFSTVSWLIATRVTPPEKPEVLDHFYQRIQPGGWWQPVTGERLTQGRILGLRLLFWAAAVVGVYACLFALGKFILLEPEAGLTWSAVVAVCGLLAYSFRKALN